MSGDLLIPFDRSLVQPGDARLSQAKLAARGAQSLDDLELLEAMLGAGVRANSIHRLSRKVLEVIEQRNLDLKVDDLCRLTGLGMGRACAIVAALEFARRRIRPLGTKVRSPADISALVSYIARRQQEHFVVITLSGAHEVIAERIITIGLVNCSQVHPREVFADAITDRACAVALVHNHPSGDLTPSQSDRDVTDRLVQAGKIIGIQVLDHVIVSPRGDFLSLRESGQVEFGG